LLGCVDERREEGGTRIQIAPLMIYSEYEQEQASLFLLLFFAFSTREILSKWLLNCLTVGAGTGLVTFCYVPFIRGTHQEKGHRHNDHHWDIGQLETGVSNVL
jgi:hypothetical protein